MASLRVQTLDVVTDSVITSKTKARHLEQWCSMLSQYIDQECKQLIHGKGHHASSKRWLPSKFDHDTTLEVHA